MSPCPEGDHLGVQACVQVHPANQADGWRVSSIHLKFNLKKKNRSRKRISRNKCLSRVSGLSRNQSPVASFFNANLPQKRTICGKLILYFCKLYTFYLALMGERDLSNCYCYELQRDRDSRKTYLTDMTLCKCPLLKDN